MLDEIRLLDLFKIDTRPGSIVDPEAFQTFLKDRIRPPVSGIRVLDFHRADEIYRQAEPVKEELRRKLETIGRKP